jgi:hypothetical protein
MRTYVTYTRVSTAEQKKSGLGLEAQERDIEIFLTSYSEVPYEVIASFSDTGPARTAGLSSERRWRSSERPALSSWSRSSTVFPAASRSSLP